MTTSPDLSSLKPIPIADFEYPDLGQAPDPFLDDDLSPTSELTNAPMNPVACVSKEEMEHSLAAALQEGQSRGVAAVRGMLDKERRSIHAAIMCFRAEIATYYGKVETELVNLSLSIAAKILHREAQLDSKLMAALAKVAVDDLQRATVVVVRVPAQVVSEWEAYFAEDSCNIGAEVRVVGDGSMAPGDCAIETDLGVAQIGISAQLKEIERGFFDLLAHRPSGR